MTKFPSVVEAYLGDLRRIRASGGATGEHSGYGPLAHLVNAIGSRTKPKVFCVGELVYQWGWLLEVRLVRNQLTGWVPPELPVVDREELGLPDCETGA